MYLSMSISEEHYDKSSNFEVTFLIAFEIIGKLCDIVFVTSFG